MSYSSRIFIYGPVSLLLLIIILYSVYWRVQADTLSARLDRANGGEIIPGLVFAFAEKSVGGYPFQLDVVLSGVTFVHHAPEGETAWSTEKLALHSLSYGPNRYIFEVTGLQSFSAPPLLPGSVPRLTVVTPAIARASAMLSGGRLARFDLDLWEPQGQDATQGANPQRSFSADRAQLHLLSRPDNTIDVAMQIDNARLGAGYAAGAEIRLPRIDLRAKVTESDALNDLSAGLSGAAEAWRARMGALAVSDLSLTWPDAHADLQGDLALNGADGLTGVLKGKRVQNGTAPAEFGLMFSDGDVRAIGASATAARSAP
jgi:hypothetical protein